MYKRLIQEPLRHKHSFFLFGPRGTGKTSWIKSCFPDQLYFDLLDQDLYISLLARPHQLAEMIPAQYQDFVVI